MRLETLLSRLSLLDLVNYLRLPVEGLRMHASLLVHLGTGAERSLRLILSRDEVWFVAETHEFAFADQIVPHRLLTCRSLNSRPVFDNRFEWINSSELQSDCRRLNMRLWLACLIS